MPLWRAKNHSLLVVREGNAERRQERLAVDGDGVVLERFRRKTHDRQTVIRHQLSGYRGAACEADKRGSARARREEVRGTLTVESDHRPAVCEIRANVVVVRRAEDIARSETHALRFPAEA